MDVHEARTVLRTARQLAVEGLSARHVADRVRTGALVRVHEGVYVAGETLVGLYPEDRHLLSVVAAAGAQRGGSAIVSHVSAAVLHGLPLPRTVLERVHVSARATRGVVGSGTWTARHEVEVPTDDVDDVGGIRCTNLARTTMDVIRSTRMETALSVADAALRAVSPDRADDRPAELLRAELWRRLGKVTGGRGVKQARLVVEMADPRAQLPGESISRLHLTELGIRVGRLQVHIPGPGTTNFYSDIELPDVPAWFEFDGESKYLDESFTRGRTPVEILRQEKEREDWIRMTTGRLIIRAEWKHLRSASTLAERLRTYGIRI